MLRTSIMYKPLLYSELWENNDYFLQDHNRIIECVLDALMYVFMWHEHYEVGTNQEPCTLLLYIAILSN